MLTFQSTAHFVRTEAARQHPLDFAQQRGVIELPRDRSFQTSRHRLLVSRVSSVAAVDAVPRYLTTDRARRTTQYATNCPRAVTGKVHVRNCFAFGKCKMTVGNRSFLGTRMKSLQLHDLPRCDVFHHSKSLSLSAHPSSPSPRPHGVTVEVMAMTDEAKSPFPFELEPRSDIPLRFKWKSTWRCQVAPFNR